MKFIKAFNGVKAGEIYPQAFAPGDDCPSELEAAALSVGAVEAKAETRAPENKGRAKK